jgi:hypothetical protein
MKARIELSYVFFFSKIRYFIVHFLKLLINKNYFKMSILLFETIHFKYSPHHITINNLSFNLKIDILILNY